MPSQPGLRMRDGETLISRVARLRRSPDGSSQRLRRMNRHGPHCADFEEKDHPELGAADRQDQGGAGAAGCSNVYKLLLRSRRRSPRPGSTTSARCAGRPADQRPAASELLVIRIAYVNGIAYVLNQHIPALALADGVTPAECEALKDWRKSTLFSPAERAVRWRAGRRDGGSRPRCRTRCSPSSSATMTSGRSWRSACWSAPT